MRADDNIDRASGQPLDDRLDVLGRAEAAEDLDSHRVVGKASGKRFAVLLRQHRGGDEHRDLLATLYREKRGPQRHLGFPVPHVPTHQAVHRLGLVQVGQDVVDSRTLATGLFKRKARNKLFIRPIEGGKGRSLGGLTRGVDFQKFTRHGQDRFAGPLLDFLPALTTQPVEGWDMAVSAGIFLHQVDPLDRQIQAVPARILQVQVIPFGTGHAEVTQALVEAHPVVDVHHVVSSSELAEPGQVVGHWPWPGLAAVPPLAKDFRFREEDQPVRRQRKPLGQMADDNRSRREGGLFPRRGGDHRQAQLVAEQEVLQVRGLERAGNRQEHAHVLFLPLAYALGQRR